jgi:hypothetical protein
VDALDECSDQDDTRSRLIEKLRDLQRPLSISIKYDSYSWLLHFSTPIKFSIRYTCGTITTRQSGAYGAQIIGITLAFVI